MLFFFYFLFIHSLGSTNLILCFQQGFVRLYRCPTQDFSGFTVSSAVEHRRVAIWSSWFSLRTAVRSWCQLQWGEHIQGSVFSFRYKFHHYDCSWKGCYFYPCLYGTLTVNCSWMGGKMNLKLRLNPPRIRFYFNSSLAWVGGTCVFLCILKE